jgi:uncharacterized protein YndB with AHSA1/START domain
MPGDYVATSSATVNAPPRKVWDIITDPAATREFMFGAELVTDWTVGGPITWRGTWEGKDYQDKGVVLDIEPGHRLVYTHFSPLAGQEDKPENYHTLTWTLQDQDDRTLLVLSQDNNLSAEAAEHSKGMWDQLVADVKRLAERG